jgi:tetratricopeptide (TPR) repeat protein
MLILSSISKYFSILLLLIFQQFLYAHGDLDIRISDASIAIEQNPDSAFLYLNRAELHYQHEEYQLASIDFHQCYQLNYTDVRVHLGLSKALLKLRQYEESIQYVDKILATDSKHVVALRLKGDILFEINQFETAAQHYELVIQYADKTFTENYLEAAHAWQNSNAENKLELSVQILQKGIENLGDLMVFYQTITELYEKHSNLDLAIQYQTKVIELSNRKEFSYVKRAQLYQLKGDIIAAKNDLMAAKSAIKQLPPSKQNQSAIVALLANVLETEQLLNPLNN